MSATHHSPAGGSPGRLSRWLAGVLLLAAAAAGSAAHADCQREADQAEAAEAAGDLDRLLAIEARVGARCSPADLASRMARQALARGDLTAADAALRKAPTSTWLTALAGGQIAERRKRWSEAAARYNEAYILMLDPGKTDPRPDRIYIDQVHALAAKAVVLSDSLDTVVTRGSGRGQGIYAARGHRPVPAPIRFQTNSDRLDATGEEQAAQLASYLKTRERDARALTLVGHADERGDDAYNLELSWRRAAALADYLRGQGVALPIATDGRGEQDPWPFPNDGPPLTDEERWALNRRVELRFE